ncbi:Signal transduction histidine kinase [Candidatus Terasakiella magnetica]|nr:Signal transduction histidine kinase [Candidatus Terasakiella magnetica]
MTGGVAQRISIIYTIVGLTWIIVSSTAVWLEIGTTPGRESLLEMIKGSAFILVTAAMLFILLRRWERNLVEMTNRLSGIINSSQDLIAAWDSQKRLTAFNPRYKAVLKEFFNRDIRPGMSIEELFGHVPDRLELFSQCWDRTLAGESFVTLQHLEQNGVPSWFETSYGWVPDADGKPAGGFHIVRDVTARMNTEEAQRHHAKKLAKTVETLTQANSELERFAYVASHDLQEPLRTITCFSQLIERDYGAGFDSRGREYLDLVTTSAKRMHGLINDLIAYARVTANEKPHHTAPIAASCHNAIANLHQAATDCGALIEVGDLPELTADPLQVMQVFQNLIDNAIKYRHPDRPLRIDIKAERQDGFWVITVADNGLGFTPGEQDVFELFRRLRPHQGYAGTGVGLAICKRIIQRHGGRIWVDSTPDQGSVFSFTLPA